MLGEALDRLLLVCEVFEELADWELVGAVLLLDDAVVEWLLLIDPLDEAIVE